jgi:uncharacterized protein (TIGR03000 family)
MYSVVLVAALVTTSATPAWCHRCSGGYSSCYSGYGCYAGYANYGGYGCYAGYQPYTCAAGGGCYRTIPGYGAAGGCYGYHGGCYGAGYGNMVFGAYYIDPAATYGQGCYGCYGGYAGFGIPVPPVVAPAMPDAREPAKDPFPPINPDVKEKKPAEPIPAPNPKTLEPKKTGRATIRMDIPQGAKLYVDGNPISVTAGPRIFSTPLLAAGQRYFYDFRIEVAVNGQIRREERRVVVESNQELAVDFSTVPTSPAIASRLNR